MNDILDLFSSLLFTEEIKDFNPNNVDYSFLHSCISRNDFAFLDDIDEEITGSYTAEVYYDMDGMPSINLIDNNDDDDE